MASTLAERGLNRLRAAWKIALLEPPITGRNQALAAACDAVFLGQEAGYKKAIVIQAAGKAADIGLDAQAMQKGVGAVGSWDAREFAKQVFVLWSNESQNPLGHSPDPYVSNPYRVARFDASVRNKRKRPAEFDSAVLVLQLLNGATSPAVAFRNLVEVMLALRRFIANRTVDYPLPNRASLPATLNCVESFVAPKSGGTRLQAVVLALFSTLQRSGMSYDDLHSRHVNASDASALSAGDVTFNFDSSSVAVEVKDRPLDAAELIASIEKCRVTAIAEMIFVIRASRQFAADLPIAEFERRRDEQFSSGLNLYVEPFGRLCEAILTIVGERGRRIFLENVGVALATQNASVTHKWAWAALVKSI